MADVFAEQTNSFVGVGVASEHTAARPRGGWSTSQTLSRRFRDLTGADINEPKSLASFGHSGLLRANGWVEVLRHRRVVLLAEAGPGKTREMRERVAALRAEGKFAFFVELDDLDRYGLTVPLQTPDDERELAVWLADGASPARF